MRALTFELYLLEPLLATRLGGGDPNSAISFEFIPGSMIRGMIAGRYARQKKINAVDETFRRLFLDGKVRFLNAYPQSFGLRMLPTPLSWFQEKDVGSAAPIYDFAVRVQSANRQWQSIKQPFCYLWDDESNEYKVQLQKPEKQISVHTSRENRQKVAKGESTIFRYEALAPDQTFCGVVLAEHDGDLEMVGECLPEGEIVSLGGSHLAGYGQARIQRVAIQHNWREYKPIGEDTNAIVVTLLSDALIRNPLTGAYISTLEPVVGFAHSQAFVHIHVIGGFNRKWNLPIPQVTAIQAGSVFVYQPQDGLLPRLQSLEVSGIGEKRAEGFGRIAINWHRIAEITTVERTISATPLPFTLQSDESISLAKRIVEGMLRQKLDRVLVASVNQLKIQNPPSNAQLSRMRIVARQALSQKSPHVIIQHLDAMKKAARDQFQRARIKNDRLDEWLRSRAKSVQGIWQLLGVNEGQVPVLGNVRPEFTEALALEYTVRLIDRVLQKAQKEATND